MEQQECEHHRKDGFIETKGTRENETEAKDKTNS